MAQHDDRWPQQWGMAAQLRLGGFFGAHSWVWGPAQTLPRQCNITYFDTCRATPPGDAESRLPCTGTYSLVSIIQHQAPSTPSCPALCRSREPSLSPFHPSARGCQARPSRLAGGGASSCPGVARKEAVLVGRLAGGRRRPLASGAHSSTARQEEVSCRSSAECTRGGWIALPRRSSIATMAATRCWMTAMRTRITWRTATTTRTMGSQGQRW